MYQLPIELKNNIMNYARPIHPCSHLIKYHKHSINREIEYIVQRLEGYCSYEKDEEPLIDYLKEGIEDFGYKYYWLRGEGMNERDFNTNSILFMPLFKS